MPTSTNNLRIVFLAAPVIRGVAHTEFPSTSAESIRARCSSLSLFMERNMHSRASIGKGQIVRDQATLEPTKTETWDNARNSETLRLAFEEAGRLPPIYGEWLTAIDTKLVGIFSVASVIIGLAPSLKWGAQLTGIPRAAWLVAVGAWLGTVWLCYVGYRPRPVRFGVIPDKLRESEWTHLTPDEYRYFRLRDMGKTFDTNGDQILAKANLASWAMRMTALEVLALLVAFRSAALR